MGSGDQGEHGPVGVRVGGYEDEVGVVRPGHRRLHSVEHPLVAVPVRGHGEFGGVVAGAAVCGDGEDEVAAPGPAQHLAPQLLVAVRLYGRRGGAALQQGDPGQYLRGFAQYEAQGDGVEAGAAELLVEEQAQQIRVGEPLPQCPVEVVRDGARDERRAGHLSGATPPNTARAASTAACCSSLNLKSTVLSSRPGGG